MRALIVGLGSIGRRHLTNLRTLAPHADITVLRRSIGSPKAASARLADRVLDSLDEALVARPDLAIVASPAACHVETAWRLAREGVHLFVEKPLSDRLERVDELINCCDQRGLRLMVGYNLRFHRPLQQVRDMLREGRVGRVVAMRAEVGMYLPDWRPDTDYRACASARRELGGGALLELSHELDYARWLLGEVSGVFAHLRKASDLEIDAEDFAELQLYFEGGAVGSIHLDMIQRAPFRGCRIIGTEGTLVWDGPSHRVSLYTAASGSWTEVHPPADIDRNAMYLSELQFFLDCLTQGKRAEPSGADGRRVLELVAAARASSEAGKVVNV